MLEPLLLDAIRLEATTLRVEAIAIRLEAVAIRLEAVGGHRYNIHT